MSARRLLVVVMALAVLGTAGLLGWRRARAPQHCADGLVALGARCCGEGQRLEGGACVGRPLRCAVGQEPTDAGCLAPPAMVAIAGGIVSAPASDWEAPNAQEVRADAFSLDRYEVTVHAYQACVSAGACAPLPQAGEPGLPVTGATLLEAQRYCSWRNGSVPRAAQLAFASMGSEGRRYPWGQTGAVCRRAAFGLRDGPCQRGASTPQLAGAHASGASPDGVHDLAGNVAEWALDGERAVVMGGSWRSAGAWELRGWQREPLAADTRRDDVGFRCAYAGPRQTKIAN